MKKFLSIVLSAFILSSMLAVSIFAEVHVLTGTEGVIDFEKEGQTDEDVYKRTQDGNNYYAKLDFANTARNERIFKPAGDVDASKFSKGSKWEWSFDLYADLTSTSTRITFFLGNYKFQFNDGADADVYYTDAAGASKSGYALSNYALKKGMNAVKIEIEMIEDGAAKIKMWLNGTLIDWNLGSTLVIPKFATASGAVADGLEMQVNTMPGTIGLDNIKFGAAKGGNKDDGKDNSDTADMFTCVMAVAVVSTIGVAVAKKKHK